jgi:hypothetical protein
VAAIVGILLFDSSQKQGIDGGSPAAAPLRQEDATRKELSTIAVKLLADVTSGNQVAYKAAWAHVNIPPMPPSGTTVGVVEATAQVHEAYGRINATVAMPGKSVNSVIHLKRADDGQWRIYMIEEVK